MNNLEAEVVSLQNILRMSADDYDLRARGFIYLQIFAG